MNGTAIAIVCTTALLRAMLGCDDHTVPYSPGTPPVEETYPNTRVLFGVSHHRTARSGSAV
ncbi:MAG TPA: hypothetical protein VMX58_07485 [Patescibacteria group bacterium]|nr:hypothetical protein [Patescibacteria group bacterium]